MSNRPFASHVWNAPGTYTVRLIGFSDSYPNGVSATVALVVGPRDVYYVNGANSTPASPYTNWATAATTIQDAIDAGSQMGRLVLVADGIYACSSRDAYGHGTNCVFVTEGVEVRSVNGPAVTLIAGSATGDTNYGWSLRCAYVGTNSILNGFTLTNGVATGDGGGAWCERSAFVTNCTLVGNFVSLGLGNGGGAYGGTFDNCSFVTNSASSGGAAYGSTLNDCAVIGNSSGNGGGGVAFCVVNRSTLNGNYGNGEGGGAYESALSNCNLTGNGASNYGGGGVWGGILNNCVLSGNHAIYFTASGGAARNASMNNCTITGSLTTWDGPAVVGSGTLNNCIIYSNIGANYGGCTLNYCCTTPIPTNGVGNITNAPLFVDPVNNDFHLQSTSPCINAGNNAYVSGATDLDGNPRIVNGTVDIGGYEYQGTGSIISYAWLQQYGLPTDGSADYTDPDHDVMNNWQEWVCGTNPTNALSALRLLSAVPTNTNVTVSWQSIPGISYFVQRSSNLDSPNSPGQSNFVVAASNIVAQTNTTSFTDTNAVGASPLFYRVGVKSP